ncbi:YfiR family protein [Paraburkholderia phymatum]|uniref:Putative transmembrane protein n=1 Tax=Paraburkholderia phymatum (strain DSM 17167 / CIP 108236 / LMG 21445 / STM815) TaxID=391038 RepID=B2JLF1_PARP8|nr:YfiR family protein [Paraburkholderia phymatum]ACC74119.1 putative transmembrane protein [Paraburkholderia phymatum STM815]
MRTASKIAASAVAGAMAACLCIRSTRAQVDESVLTAAYVYNMTQFVTWPAGSLTDTQLVVCASGQGGLSSELEKFAGKATGGRIWTVAALAGNEKPSRCNVIVLERETPVSRALADVLASDSPVLVIANFDMGSRPWIVRLFTEDDHIRFDIDKSEAGRRRLSLSSRLLRLARSVL